MKRSFLLFPLVALAIALVSCSGNSSIPPGLVPNISGSWEFIAYSSTNPGYSTGIEVALKEGQVLVNGNYVENGQISASGQQISFVGFTAGAHATSPPSSIVFGGNCAAASDNMGNSLTGSVSTVGGSINFTYTENGNVFNVTAILDASGQTLDSGTYTELAAPAGQSNGACNPSDSTNTTLDTGTITGKAVSKLSGTYLGKLCQPLDTLCADTKDAASATLSQSGTTLTVNLLLSGAENVSLTLTGPVTGNAFYIQGTLEGQTVAYNGYYEETYDSSDSSYDIQTIYLVNATNPAQPNYAGTLVVPLVP